MFKNKKGFTLIELLIVIAIIGILMAVVLVVLNPTGQRNKATDSNNKQTVAKVAQAMTACFVEKNAWASCNTTALLKAANHLDSAFADPTDPAGFTYGASGCVGIPNKDGTGNIRFYYGYGGSRTGTHCTNLCAATADTNCVY